MSARSKARSGNSRQFSWSSLWQQLLSADRTARKRKFAQLAVESLEDRTLLSSIFGNVFGDVAGTGVLQPPDPSLASQIVYLDLNGDGKFDSAHNTVSNSAPSFVAGQFSLLNVSNLLPTDTNVTLTLDVTNTYGQAVPVVLISPTGLSSFFGGIPDPLSQLQGPYAITIPANSSFTGALDQTAATSINQAPLDAQGNIVSGTYAPQESFSATPNFINGVNPNGEWGLLFVTPDGGNDGLVLKSWSLTFTQADPSTQTDAHGNYSFPDAPAGNYNVNLVVPSGDTVTTPGGASQPVSANGNNFGLKALPDLTGVSFTLASPATAWGQSITVNFTITNEGGNASAFNAGLYLSANGVISNSGPLVDAISFPNSLAAGAYSSGTVTFTLPASAPAGFDTVSDSYVGLVIDPAGALQETGANQSNQGPGIDSALLGTPANNALTSANDAADTPTIAVDPKNGNLVTAYMDYGLLSDGYAGIGITVSTPGGAILSTSSVPLPSGFDAGAAMPDLAFDAQGNLYVSFMAATFLGAQPGLTNPASSSQRTLGFQSNNGIFVAKSSDDGATWGTPVPVDTNVYTGTGAGSPTQDPNAVPFDAYPALAVDTSATSPTKGNVYVTWTRFYPGRFAAPANQYPGGNPATNAGGSDVMIAVSNTGGSSFTTEAPGGASALRGPGIDAFGPSVSGNGGIKYSSVTVGAGGAVYVAADSAGAFVVFSSTNAGQSFLIPSTPYPGSPQDYIGNPFDYTQTGVLPDPTLDNFSTFRTRAIAADPNTPGLLYAIAPSGLAQAEAEPKNLTAANGIVFAVSTDYGASWTSNFTVGNEPSPLASLTPPQINFGYFPVLNDDNAGQYPGFAATLATQVVANQAFPAISISPTGVITVVWYDTRQDAANQQLAVWGTVSTDGGQHFSANFPISNTTFAGNADFSIGSQVGVVATGSTAYAVWTDTRNGTQQIFSGSYSLSTLPAAPVDRFAPDFTQQTAAPLGQVSATQTLPQLNLLPGNGNEWFTLQAGATGNLDVSVAANSAGSNLNVVITDAHGNVITPASITSILDSTGAVIGTDLIVPSISGDTYLIHVFGNNTTGIGYTLNVGTLTADFGTEVEGVTTGTVIVNTTNLYRLTAGVTGTLEVTLTGGSNIQGVPLADGSGVEGGVNLSILGADGHTVLATDLNYGVGAGQSEQLAIQVTAGQVVFFQINGINLSSDSGDFRLQFTNFDQSESLSAPIQGQGSTTDTIFNPVNSYQYVAGLTGTLNVTFTGVGPVSGNMTLSIIGDEEVLASDGGAGIGDGTGGDPTGVVQNSETLSIPVTAGQSVFLQVSSTYLNAEADYTLAFTNTPATTDQTLFFPTSGDPTSLAVAALNGPNAPLDLLTATSNGGDFVNVLTGNGDGTFQPETQYAVGPGQNSGALSGSRQIAVADLTGNGVADVLVPNYNSAGISVLLGNGAGGFQPQRRFDAVANPTSSSLSPTTAKSTPPPYSLSLPQARPPSSVS